MISQIEEVKSSNFMVEIILALGQLSQQEQVSWHIYFVNYKLMQFLVYDQPFFASRPVLKDTISYKNTSKTFLILKCNM